MVHCLILEIRQLDADDQFALLLLENVIRQTTWLVIQMGYWNEIHVEWFERIINTGNGSVAASGHR